MAKKDFKEDVATKFMSAAEKQEEIKDLQEVKEEIQEEKEAKAQQEINFVVPKGYKLVKENKSERMQLLVRPTLKKYIKKQAKSEKISMNDLINNILEEYMERDGK